MDSSAPAQASRAPRTKPLLRGYSHEAAAHGAIAAATALVLNARNGSARAAAVTYGVTLVMLFVASAVLHRPHWTPRVRSVLGRLDHAAIFFLIAGTYTPIALLLGALGAKLLVAVWAGAAAGIAVALLWPAAPKWLMALLCVLLGWIVTLVAPAVHAALGSRGFALLVVGGAIYTAGAAVYAFRRPDPLPRVFGYHEIFHLLVITAAACHFLVVKQALAAIR
ncbi:MAG TPA: hemolysin III family protein [Anaeromyxobacteraceae bacterium]|nr:hemolysin III family protein [Anaeromyxobacteraceae bacterium]